MSAIRHQFAIMLLGGILMLFIAFMAISGALFYF